MMKKAIKKVSNLLGQPQEHIRHHITQPDDSDISFYRNSIHKFDGSLIAMARDHVSRFLIVFSERQGGVITRFTGEQIGDVGIHARLCPLDATNAAVLRELFFWTTPVSLKKQKTTIGCGDRLGLASAGHIAAIKHFDGVKPVLAQQSMRELKLTNRTYRQVVDDAVFQVFQVGYEGGYGADGDHLKTIPDIDLALESGMPMITLDLSDVMRADAAKWGAGEIEKEFATFPEAERSRLLANYAGKEFSIAKSPAVKFSKAAVMRCAVMYHKAMDFAAEVNSFLKQRRGEDYDLEISIDETTVPTLPEDHVFIINELHHRKVKPSSIAPRFIGEFQKGIDYIGDNEKFSSQFAIHCAIAATYGGYKISVHSGSDKFAVFPAIGSLTKGHVHLKTAGTSWLESLRMLAEEEHILFKVIYKRALIGFNEATKLYHVKTNLSMAPDIDKLYEDDYPKLLNRDDVRQILHITYGTILNDHSIRPMFFSAMHKHEEYYHELVMAHFEKHLSALKLTRRA